MTGLFMTNTNSNDNETTFSSHHTVAAEPLFLSSARVSCSFYRGVTSGTMPLAMILCGYRTIVRVDVWIDQ